MDVQKLIASISGNYFILPVGLSRIKDEVVQRIKDIVKNHSSEDVLVGIYFLKRSDSCTAYIYQHSLETAMYGFGQEFASIAAPTRITSIDVILVFFSRLTIALQGRIGPKKLS